MITIKEKELRGDVVNVVDCDILISEFKLQSRYCIHFQTRNLGNSMDLLTSPAVG